MHKDLLARITDQSAPVPFIPGIDVALARQVAAVADRLTPEEIEAFVQIGIAANRRTSRMVPVLGTVG